MKKDSIMKIIDNLLEEYFYSKIDKKYIPAIIKDGNLQDEGYDLYMKTILVNPEKSIDRTWIVDNLAHSMSNDIFNCIVTYNYKFNNIYGINPFLIDDYTVFVEQKDLYVLDMVYDDVSVINKPSVLKTDEQNIFIYFDILRDKLPEFNFFPKYKVYAEIEYRKYVDRLKIQNRKEKVANGFIDVQCIEETNGKDMLWIRATIEIDSKRLIEVISKIENNSTYLNIKVVDLESGQIRDLDTNNYNDDIHAGLIVFKKESYKVLSEYYYFYDMTLISKDNRLNSCLVDNIGDWIVFWEGEFNSNLPYEIKMKLVEYNDISKTDHIISKGMFEWQLNSNWNYLDEALPNEKLANFIKNNYLGEALAIGLDFYPPKDITSYSIFVNKIFELLKITYDDLKISNEKLELLKGIRKGVSSFDDEFSLFKNYQGFCYLINEVLGNEEK